MLCLFTGLSEILNRVRKVVYEVSSRFRREHNALIEK